MKIFKNLTEFTATVGSEIGISDWVLISQERIQQFAEATGDFQWIHTDAEKAAKESPFGTTIAHGFLTLSLAPMLKQQIYAIKSVKMGINYGANKVRFTNTVPTGSRIRMKATLLSAEPHAPNGIRMVMECIFESEGISKPVCIAELVSLVFE